MLFKNSYGWVFFFVLEEAVFNHFDVIYQPVCTNVFFLSGRLNTNDMLCWWILSTAVYTPRVIIFFCVDRLTPVMELFLSHLHYIHRVRHAIGLKYILKWTGWLCRSFIFNLVALVFTGCYRSLRRDMSPHWKWSASILSAHFFLIRWFVSLGNWSQPQPRCLWKFKAATYPLLCEKKKSSWIKYWVEKPSLTQWVDSLWLKVRPHK